MKTSNEIKSMLLPVLECPNSILGIAIKLLGSIDTSNFIDEIKMIDSRFYCSVNELLKEHPTARKNISPNLLKGIYCSMGLNEYEKIAVKIFLKWDCDKIIRDSKCETLKLFQNLEEYRKSLV